MKMSKFNFFLLTLVYLFVHHPKPVHPQINSPYTVTYPWDLGDVIHIDDFFQTDKYEMGWTKVFYEKDKDRYSCMMPTNEVELNSIIYRTSLKKGVVFFFQPGSLDNLPSLYEILKGADRPSNIYVLPVYATDDADKEKIVDYTSFLNIGEIKAHVAFGFVEKAPHSQQSYTQEDLDNLAKQMDPLCRERDTPHYIALNAYRLSGTNPKVTMNYYKLFRRCKLLLYLPTGSPPVNVRQVRKLTTDQINHYRTKLVIPGRNLPIRFYSLHNVAWWYCMGHEWSDKLGENGLLRIFNSGATLLRVPVYPLSDTHELKDIWVLRPMSEYDIYRINFSADLVGFVSQLADKSRLVVIRPEKPKYFTEIQRIHFSTSKLPFYEAIVMVGPNAPAHNESDITEYWATCENSDLTGYKILFRYIEGNSGPYTPNDVTTLLQALNRPSFRGAKLGVILEISFMSSQVSWKQVAEQVRNFHYVFLKSDFGELSDDMLVDMALWVKDFDDQIIVLMFDEKDVKVNNVFQHFTRQEPEDTSNWDDGKVTTLIPPPPTKATTPTTPRELITTTIAPTEPTPDDKGSKNVGPNSSTRIHCWGMGVLMALAGIVLASGPRVW